MSQDQRTLGRQNRRSAGCIGFLNAAARFTFKGGQNRVTFQQDGPRRNRRRRLYHGYS